MNSIKPIISLFLFFVCCIHTLPQLTPDHVASPNAASLGRFGDIPVSYYTGRADVSIPLYKTTQRGVELDISLHYDTSGLLMNSLPGWTGNGWTLNAGGVITRCVNIRNDEYVFPPHVQNQMICPAYNYFQSYSSLSTLLQNPNNDYRQLKDSLSNCINDYAPDVFYFNFMGKSGRFMLGNDGQWKVYCDENIDVMFNINDEDNYIRPFVKDYHNNMGYYQPKTIKGFTIVDDQGKSSSGSCSIRFHNDFFTGTISISNDIDAFRKFLRIV